MVLRLHLFIDIKPTFLTIRVIAPLAFLYESWEPGGVDRVLANTDKKETHPQSLCKAMLED